MSDDKQIIKKLLKIAENQQKIITKLAQTLSEPVGGSPLSGVTPNWEDVSNDVAAKLATIPGTKGYSVNSAEYGAQSGSIRGKLVYPMSATNYYDVLKALKSMLIGNTVKTNDGKDVKVSSNPQDVSFTGMT